MSLDALKAGIKQNELSGVWLFCGREEYTKDYYAGLIRKKVDASPLPEFNHIYFDASAQSVGELEEAMFSLPYMWEVKLIEIVNLEPARMTEADAAEYERLFSDIPDYLTVLIVLRESEYSSEEQKKSSAGDGDKKKKSGIKAFIKSVEKHGAVVSFDKEDGDKLASWIIRHFNADGVTFEPNVPREIIARCGNDMYILQSEVTKLTAAFSGKPLCVEDVRKYCCENIEYKYFDLVNALNRRDIISAKKILDGLELGRDEVPMAVGLLAKNYSEMLLVKAGLDAGKSGDRLASELKIQPWKVGKLVSAVGNSDIRAVAYAVTQLALADKKLKSSGFEAEKVLEMMFYRICAYGRKA